MPINKRQHFISQFTIREFMGDQDRLFCLDKSTLKVTDRQHGCQPKNILNEAYYYTTDTDDFDGDIVSPLEHKLAPICKEIVAEPDRELTTQVMDVLIDWCALSLARSIYFAHVAPIVYESLSDDDKSKLPEDGRVMILAARRSTYERVRCEMRKMHMMFRFLKSPCPFGYLLTDQLAAPIPYRRVGAIGPLLLPLSHNLILVQVPKELADDFYRSLSPTLEWLTLIQCGWAERLIYSADLRSLDRAIFILSEGSGDLPIEMRKRARQPFFGFGSPSELASMWSDGE